MTDAIVVMVTCGSRAEAETIAERLVEERLVACAGIAGEVRSIFHWQGAISRETETLLIMKTQMSCFEPLSRRVKELHSYQVPEIIALPILSGTPDYLSWIRDSTRPQ